ncbi:MAG: 2OG-Fe(II) oxygenase, partial [Nitrospira sp. NTP1]|nr:2OG-Fe(II) oxygenase [Nitrospira sp. NTP1]
MTQACVSGVTEAVDRAVAALDLDRLEREYWAQNEFLY